MNICNHPLSERLGGVPIVSLHTGAPLMPMSNTCARGPTCPPAASSGRRATALNSLTLAQCGNHGVLPDCSCQLCSVACLMGSPAQCRLVPLSPSQCTDTASTGRAGVRRARGPASVTLTKTLARAQLVGRQRAPALAAQCAGVRAAAGHALHAPNDLPAAPAQQRHLPRQLRRRLPAHPARPEARLARAPLLPCT